MPKRRTPTRSGCRATTSASTATRSLSPDTCPGACSMLLSKALSENGRHPDRGLEQSWRTLRGWPAHGRPDQGTGPRHLLRPKCAAARDLCLPRQHSQGSCRKARSSAITPFREYAHRAGRDNRARDGFLNQANVPEDFIRHIFATPSDSVWYPTSSTSFAKPTSSRMW